MCRKSSCSLSPSSLASLKIRGATSGAASRGQVSSASGYPVPIQRSSFYLRCHFHAGVSNSLSVGTNETPAWMQKSGSNLSTKTVAAADPWESVEKSAAGFGVPTRKKCDRIPNASQCSGAVALKTEHCSQSAQDRTVNRWNGLLRHQRFPKPPAGVERLWMADH